MIGFTRERKSMRRAAKRAFTLVELLVVIAISTILLGLLLYPLFYAQQITNRVQSQATAQDAARNGVERISRELSQATFVFDNTATAVVIPLSRTNSEISPLVFNDIVPSVAPIVKPRILFARLDYILPESNSSDTTIDPTTGKPLTGNHITFPLAPGTRVVRNFLGLADNAKPYANRYEFRATDTDFNPLLLYRAEFDPTDPDLVRQGPYPPGETDFAPGRFNDPNFFYNTANATTTNAAGKVGNGRPYAENWKRKASAVISGPRLDMLAWRRDSSRELIPDLPFQTMAYFAPAAVPGDAATPGSLTAGNAETPGAPPTLYSAQHGQWTLPFTVTFFRSTTHDSTQAPTNVAPTSAYEGSVRFVVEMDNTVNPARARVGLVSSSGTLATTPNLVFTSLSPVSGKIFVKTPRLTFSVDPLRGRIETGFPPLAGTIAGVPLLDEYDPNTKQRTGVQRAFVAGIYPDANFGELIPTVLSMNTLDPRVGNPGVRPDQGIWGLDLFDMTATRYVSLNFPIPAQNSPLRIFGDTGMPNDFAGIMIAPGTEQVLGPEMPMSATVQLLPYNRVNDAVGTDQLLDKSFAGLAGDTAMPYAPVNGQRNYVLSQFLQPNRALLRFDAGTGVDVGNGLLGVPASGSPLIPDPNTPGLPASQALPRELRVSYLWQNNFARDAQGYPLSAADVRAATADFKPEGDVVKVDYSTRSLLNVQIGARVHDSNAPVPQTIQFSDKVRVGNAVR
jgi:prepilin-type N-terminal cleavage/methylation domain-containing protein